MEVKDAVKIAKAYISDLFRDENIIELGLEEVEFDDTKKEWNVTVGFRRPWKRKKEPSDSAVVFQPYNYHDRWYKLVRIRDVDGDVLAVKDRELKAA